MPETAVGVYPIRVQTDDGISNPFLLAVGQLPQVAEKEDNSTFETAQAIPEPPLVVEGGVAGNDVDFFRFHGKKGQRIVVDAQCARIGSGIDPTIRLTTAAANRAYVASADDSPGLLTDARLTAVLPEDGDYVVEISDSRYQGASRPVYRLVIGAVPMAEEVYPLGGRPARRSAWNCEAGRSPAVKIAAAHVERRHSGPTCSSRGSSSAMIGLADVAAGAGPRRRIAGAAGRSRPIPRSASRPTRRPRRSGPSRRSCSTAGSTRPATRIGSSWRSRPGQRLRIKVQAYEHRLGARRRPARGRDNGAVDRERRRHHDSAAAQERHSPSRSSCPTRRSSSRSPAGPARSPS